MSRHADIVVLGSLNADLVQKVSRIPDPGETLEGGNLETFGGGKGANQAFAAALSTTKPGAQNSVPGRDEVERLLLYTRK